MKVIRFEIQVDELENVSREIEMKPSQTFKELSDAIIGAFHIKATRGAAFFTSNNKWQKLNEITLGKDSKFEKPINGLKTSIEKVFKENKRFIYFSEDVPQFTFLMVAEERESKADPKKFPRVVKSEGTLPAVTGKKFTDNIFSDDFGSQTGEVYDASDSDLHPEGT
ncbi:MAG TPA: hypothetical protein VNJ07_10430 [Chitinophagales bacterium]|nr:hypothetical protein [Chitinophagales bacterium]